VRRDYGAQPDRSDHDCHRPYDRRHCTGWIQVRADWPRRTGTDRTDYRFPLAIHEASSATNLEAAIRFKAVAGKVDQAGGIAIRVRDADNYYVVRANALEDNVRFYRVVQGRREQLEGANVKVTPNEWHTLGLRAEGERFTVTYDGKTLYSATDKTFASAGKIALWTKADSVTRFDQVKVVTLP